MLVFPVALYELDGQVGVLDIVTIPQKLVPAKRCLVAGRRQLVSHLFRHSLIKYLRTVRIYRHATWATRSYLPVQ